MKQFLLFQNRAALALSMGFAFAMVFSTGTLSAEDFRIETKIYSGEEEEPVARAITLFEAGVVYDFLGDTLDLSEPKNVAIYRPGSQDRLGRFIMLDMNKKEQREFTTEQIERLLSKVKLWSANQTDPFRQFCASPSFDRTFDQTTGRLEFKSEIMTYSLNTVSHGKKENLDAYRDFTDWYARLNAVTDSGMLPYPRLHINSVLHEFSRVPTEVRLQIPKQDLDIRVEHVFTWRLSKTDMQRIENVRSHLHEFKTVGTTGVVQATAVDEGN